MNVDQLRDNIIQCRKQIPDDRTCLVGISGIDACGKGDVSSRLAKQLQDSGQRVALINVDGWLNLPHIRFSASNAGEHFYNHALRLDKMFEQLILPLKYNREVDITTEFAEETAANFRPHTYRFKNVDIILLEGIFLFKREYVHHYDSKIWIECSFDKALERAIARRQENLSEADTIAAYERIYFPAERHHLTVDEPIAAADMIYFNE